MRRASAKAEGVKVGKGRRRAAPSDSLSLMHVRSRGHEPQLPARGSAHLRDGVEDAVAPCGHAQPGHHLQGQAEGTNQ